MKRIDALTSLRFFAAASIVLFHMQGRILPMDPTPALALGVSFFFVLSGFILAYVYRDGINLKKFYLARFARLWPVHAVTLALTVWLLVPHLLSRSEWTLPLLANATLLHAWVPVTGYVFSFNGVSWSISAELFFYLLFPLLMGRLLGPAIAVFAAFVVMALLALETYPAQSVLWQFSPVHFVLQHPAMRVLEFAVGVAAGRLFVRRQVATGTAAEIVAVVAVLAFAFASTYTPSSYTGRWVGQSGGMLIFAAAIYVFAHQAGMVSRALSWKPLVLLGEISFSTYMLHQIVIKYAVSQKWTEGIGTTWAALAIVAVVYAGSYILWSAVEVPCRKAILRGYESRRNTTIVTSREVKSTAEV